MMETHQVVLDGTRIALLCAIPALLFLAAAFAAISKKSLSRLPRLWWCGRVITGVVLLAALCSTILLIIGGPMVGQVPLSSPLSLPELGRFGELALSVRIDVAGAIFLVLVNFIGAVIVRYSQTYLAGEPGQPRYIRALLATLAFVNMVIVTNNLLVLAIAWLSTSLCLHSLLTFYANRPQAVIVAHKKFLASRLADLCLFAGVALVGVACRTFDLDRIASHVESLAVLPLELQAAAILIALCAIIKCAQLPLHGWLIQVMEAPTPVSALLHAGVVNLGGFVLIRLSSLMAVASGAQILLVLVGSLSAALASMVMMTRISIKVSLAWSTCAQMGFMLMQCGLGMTQMALIHLLAHSLYKAHAFLAAGSTVEQFRVAQLGTGHGVGVDFGARIGAGLAGLVMVLVAGVLFGLTGGLTGGHDRPVFALGFIVALALGPLLVPQWTRIGARWSATLAIGAFMLALAYFGMHALASQLVDVPADRTDSLTMRSVFVVIVFGLLFVLQSVVMSRPNGVLARQLYPVFYAGFYLDALFTRLTFRIWPARFPLRGKRTKYNSDAKRSAV
jgi:NAD(P)H-quinone oxidoreductase subunit 5